MYNQNSVEPLSKLVDEYAPLVKRIAHHMLARLPSNIYADDLYQAGMEGLLEAAQRYNHEKGASFSTFAGIRIRGAILDEIRRGDWSPRSVHRNTRKIAGAIYRIESVSGEEARGADIAKALNIPLDQYHAMLNDTQGTRLFSFDEFLENHEESPLQGEAMSLAEDTPLAQVERESLRAEIAQAIRSLPKREQLVLSLYYDDELNLREIGDILNVSESRVSQIHSQAAARIRARLGSADNDETV